MRLSTLILVFYFGFAGIGGGLFANNDADNYQGDEIAENIDKSSVHDLIEKNKKAIVSIMCFSANQDYNKNYFLYNGEDDVSWGSGFVIRENGYILTNSHVVDNSKKIIVKYDGEEYEAELVGQDYPMDIAVIKIKPKKDSKEKFSYIEIGNNEEKLNVGEDVVIVGNPYNYGLSVSRGIVSAVDRIVTDSSRTVKAIQTDAAIESGSSGGPVFAVDGRVVGMSFYRGGYNIGFIIPIDMNLVSIIQNLIDFGYNQNGYIGVDGITLNNFLGTNTNLSHIFGYGNTTTGVLITDIEKNSPAEKAGLLVSDIVISCDGKKVSGIEDLNNIISNTMISSSLDFVVLRNSKRIKLRIKVEDNPFFTRYNQLNEKIKSNSIEFVDMFLSKIDDALIERYGITAKKNEGMYILDVKANGLVTDKNIQKGDILLTLNQTQIRSKEDIEKFVDEVKAKREKGKNITSIVAIIKKADTGKSEVVFLNSNYFTY